MERSKEQRLVDIMFELVMIATNDKKFCKRPRGERMAWVANQLRDCGFDTAPIGMSWGVLIDPELREKFGPPKTIDIDNNTQK